MKYLIKIFRFKQNVNFHLIKKIISVSVENPWERSVAVNKVPYYIK